VPDLVTKQQLAAAAKTLASSFALVERGSTLFVPVDWQTESPLPLPDPKDTIWLPMSRDDKLDLAASQSLILFGSDSELRSFEFMLAQLSQRNRRSVDGILIRTEHGLKMLNTQGKLVDPTGEFTPNFVRPMLNEEQADKDRVLEVLTEWLGSAEEVESLLNHLATILAPHYSAVKYVLLLGEGRNGKGVLLAMLYALFGAKNISNVTRQLIAEHSPTTAELNNKLLNLVFDGEQGYIKESSMEKTLIAGEPAVVRMLYDSGTTTVRTNALFIEALNLEPKARDKSPALQKRLARFQFPKVYKLDHAFRRMMTSEPMLGAFLSLLIDHYVREEEVDEKLALTAGSLELQLEQVWLGSPVLQFIEHLSSKDPAAITKINAGQMTTESFLASFKPWAEQQGVHDRSDGDLLAMMKTSFKLGWKTSRVNGKPTSRRVIQGLQPEVTMALKQLEAPDALAGQAVVGD